jgi:hypothetical protein
MSDMEKNLECIRVAVSNIRPGIENIATYFKISNEECEQIYYGFPAVTLSEINDAPVAIGKKKNISLKKKVKIENCQEAANEIQPSALKNEPGTEIALVQHSVFSLSASEIQKMKVSEIKDILKSLGIKFEKGKEGGKKNLQVLLCNHIQQHNDNVAKEEDDVGKAQDEVAKAQDVVLNEVLNEVVNEEEDEEEDVAQDVAQDVVVKAQDVVVNEVVNEEEEDVVNDEEDFVNDEEDVVVKAQDDVVNDENDNQDDIIVNVEGDAEDKIVNGENWDGESETEVMLEDFNGEKIGIDYKNGIVYKLDDDGDWVDVGKWNKETESPVFHKP